MDDLAHSLTLQTQAQDTFHRYAQEYKYDTCHDIVYMRNIAKDESGAECVLNPLTFNKILMFMVQISFS